MRYDTMPSPKPEHMSTPPPSSSEQADTLRPPSAFETADTQRPPSDTILDIEEMSAGAAAEDREMIDTLEKQLEEMRKHDKRAPDSIKKIRTDSEQFAEGIKKESEEGSESGPLSSLYLRQPPPKK